MEITRCGKLPLHGVGPIFLFFCHPFTHPCFKMPGTGWQLVSCIRHVLRSFRVLQYYIKHFCVLFFWEIWVSKRYIFLQRTPHDREGNTVDWKKKSEMNNRTVLRKVAQKFIVWIATVIRQIYNFLETKINVKKWFSKPPPFVFQKVLDRVTIESKNGGRRRHLVKKARHSSQCATQQRTQKHQPTCIIIL
jgi:hypothetical protein